MAQSAASSDGASSTELDLTEPRRNLSLIASPLPEGHGVVVVALNLIENAIGFGNTEMAEKIRSQRGSTFATGC